MSNPAEEIITARGPLGDSAGHQSRLRRSTLAFYGSGMLVQDTLAVGLNTLLLFYLTVVCGLSGSLAGGVLGLTLVADSFIDPLVGSISDNSRSRHGRRHPFMLGAIIPVALGFGLLFSVPVGLTGFALAGYALAMVLMVRVGLSFFQVPYIALGAELSEDYAERSTIVAARVLCTVIAGVTSAVLAYGVFLKGHDGQLHRAAYSPFAWTCGALVIAGGLLATLGTLGSRARLHTATPGQTRGRLLAEVVEVFRNRSFCILFGACLSLFVGLGFAGSLALHTNVYFWRLQPSQILLTVLSLSLGYFVGVFLAMALTRRLEKRVIALIGIGLIGVAQFTPAMLKVTGLIPPAWGLGTLMITTAGAGVGAACSLIGFQSMMADAADEHEELFGARREGLYFAGISFSAKASSGIGAMLAGFALDLIRFPHGLAGAAGAHVTIPAGTILRLGLLNGPGAAAITAIAMVVLALYRRGRVEHEAVREALAARRLANAELAKA